MDTVGILPAAGLCSRWNGTYKELLPTWENTWVIDSSIDSMKQAGVHNFVIVSSPQKISSHVQHFSKNKYKDINISYVIQYTPTGLYDAIKLALVTSRNYDQFIFTMPDTLISGTACIDILETLNYDGDRIKFALGIFPTDIPERFGILKYSIRCGSDKGRYLEYEIVDKPDVSKVECNKWYIFLDGASHYMAWGMAGWRREFTEFVLNSPEITTIEGAFNEYNNLNKSGCYNSFMTRYADLASWKDYVQWLKENTN